MGKLLGLYLYLRARLAEPSTHAAVCSLLLAAGVNVDAGVAHDIIVTISLAFGGMGFFVKEQSAVTKID